MAHDVISTCPVCQDQLAITRLHCRNCGTSLEGEFAVGRFGRLTAEQLALLESFLRSRGNLREMERELGISYPTVRGRLEALLRALGLGSGSETSERLEPPAAPEPQTPPEPPERPSRPDAPQTRETAAGERGADAATADPTLERRRILERLARHELSAEEAAAALRAVGGTR